MHRIKSIFISLAVVIWLCSSIYIIKFGLDNAQWHIGAILSSGIPLLFLSRLFIFKTPRTDRNLKYLLLFVFAGLFDELIWAKEKDTMIIILSILSTTLWFLYTYWYSIFPNRFSEILEVGNTMPDFSFLSADAKEIVLDGKGDRKRIYLFYRGNWCPLCMAQIKEIVKAYSVLNEMGVEVALISAQPHTYSIKLANKMKVPFLFLTDLDGKVAKELNIYAEGGTPLGMEVLGFSSDTTMPTVVITDEKNTILFVDQTDNYRVRPEPSTFINILKEHH